ncbi:CRISPR system precrRNA processing endoribonuclease RAMP protein Cas6 [Paludibaculum fermentans]|uniref:CRISPR system precrRNA processing endoribonuclease RAMP protein Cas6 n=1 Tax=Paludibaculum fermentans TaxID=1473598 RepID=UPI003EBF44A5
MAALLVVDASAGHGRGCDLDCVCWGQVAQTMPAIVEAAARRIRLVFLTPTVFKLERAATFRPEDFAARFFEHSLGRAVQMHRTCSQMRLPWVEAPAMRVELRAHRLFHYELPRHSFRQEKWLDFDGVVGWMELEGDVTQAMMWARSAELLHFGQKAAFGLGRVRVLVLE